MAKLNRPNVVPSILALRNSEQERSPDLASGLWAAESQSALQIAGLAWLQADGLQDRLDHISELVPALILGLEKDLLEVVGDSWNARNRREQVLFLLELGAEPRMNHLRALQSGLGSLDRLEAERIHLESKRNQFKQLREEFIDRADLCCSCRRQRPGQAKARSSRERTLMVS